VELEPAQRIPLSQVVLDQLLAQIRNGSLRPGDRLPGEYELMRRLGVGRSSVREALRGLITLGLVETKPSRGAVVLARTGSPLAHLRPYQESIVHLQKWAVLDLLEVRESLEGQAAELAAERATPADLVAIERAALDVEKRIAEGHTYFRANTVFHLAIARASHNSVLAESLQYLLKEVRAFRERLMREIKGITARDMAEHRAIREAIQRRKPAGARAAMVRHIRSFAKLVRDFGGSDPPEKRMA
jgi:GntR family transcriptional repressor for pyruvate dehydrogenase complex